MTHYNKQGNNHPYICNLTNYLIQNNVNIIEIGPFFRNNIFSNFKKLIKFRKNIIHIHWFPFNIETWLPFFILFKILRYKIVYTVHNTYPHEANWWKIFASKFLYNHSDHLVVHYKHNKCDLNKLNIKNNISIVPIPNLNFNRNNYTKEKAKDILSINSNNKILLFFGSIRAYKGIDDLLKAFEKIENNFKNIKLFIVGSEKWSTYKINNKKNNIYYINKFIPEDKIELYFKASDLVVFPFKKVYGSASLLLAHCFNKPFVSTKTGGIPEEVNTYGGGLLANPCDPVDLASKINQALKYPPKYKIIRNITNSYSSNKYLKIYNSFKKQ